MAIFDGITSLVDKIFGVSKKNEDSNHTNKWVKYVHEEYRLTHCKICASRHKKIYPNDNTKPKLPAHFNCDCRYEKLKQIMAGTATALGTEGADYYLKHYGKLPDYYITKEEAKKLEWDSKLGNLAKVAPGKMIGGDRYYDNNEILPKETGRIWYECDINYEGGYRNSDRLVYSNDGLVFLSKNHFKEFIWVEKGE